MRRLALCSLVAVAAVSWAQRPTPYGQQNDPPKAKATAENASKAKQLLQKAMSRIPIYNVRAIIVQRMDPTSNVMQQVKVEISITGKLHQTVVSPLQYQGIELVDDGVSTRTYTPDDKSVIVQPSARQDTNDVPFRLKLVDQNYSLRIGGHEKVAGRLATIVEAIPRNDDLESRYYSVDDKTGFLLRLETGRDGKQTTTHFETKMVDFPADFPEATFHLDLASPGIKVKRFTERCVSPNAASQLRDELKFQPVIPSNLPYGFEVQDLQASSGSELPALAVRITDGLAKATVYQWRKKGSGYSPVPSGTRVMYTGRLTLLISGDVPDEVKDRLLRAFVRASQGERAYAIPVDLVSRALELGCDVNMFSEDGELQGLAPLIFAIPAPVGP